jgi:predicted ATP-dependent serine protease
MSTPKQPCPKCRFEIGGLLYCLPLNKDDYFCPQCGIKIQGKCSSCGTWLTVIESKCSKCGTENPFHYEEKPSVKH